MKNILNFVYSLLFQAVQVNSIGISAKVVEWWVFPVGCRLESPKVIATQVPARWVTCRFILTFLPFFKKDKKHEACDWIHRMSVWLSKISVAITGIIFNIEYEFFWIRDHHFLFSMSSLIFCKIYINNMEA